ncbi:MAG: hypothetical protein IJO91_05615 [Oscillospiraceae bacterium]|nr:hypothetical protein [Oscillospiraceae bacterium]
MTEKERLVALINEAQIECDDNYGMTHSGQMADYLLENGVIAPPCKIGDKVWYHDYVPTSRGLERILRSSEVREITIDSHCSFITLASCTSLALEKFGETVFLTREEAEAALENMKGARS